MMELFKTDYYRMTGKRYRFPECLKYMILMHNLRYMYWWRRQNNHRHDFLAKIQCYRYSRKYGLEIGNCQIGNGLYIGHPYNITVNADAIIGHNCNIHKGAVIGNESRGKRKGSPVMGNHVWIGINACVVGNIKVGNDVMIAPNTFVNFDVPDHSVVIGNPGKIYSKNNATEGYIGFCVEQ